MIVSKRFDKRIHFVLKAIQCDDDDKQSCSIYKGKGGVGALLLVC
jgi:hypothetical protein